MNNFLSSIVESPETRFIIAGIQTVLFMILGIFLRKSLLNVAQQKPSFKVLTSIAAGALYGLCTSLGIVFAVKLIDVTTSYWYPMALFFIASFSITIGEVFLKLYLNRKQYNERQKQ